MEHQEKLIKAVNAELEEWLCSGDTDYLYKAMAVIRAAIEKEEETYSLGPCCGGDSALIAAANESIKAFHELQNELDSVNAAQKSNEDAAK